MKAFRGRSFLIATVIALLLVAGVAWLGARAWLAGEKPRQLTSRRTAQALDAQAGFAPIRWNGIQATSSGFLAVGDPGRSLRRLVAREISADFTPLQILGLEVGISELRIAELQAAYGGSEEKIDLVLEQKPELFDGTAEKSAFDVDVRRTVIDQGSIFWGEPGRSLGSVRDVSATLLTQGKGLQASGGGGSFRQTGFPEMEIGQFTLTYADSQLQIERGDLSVEKGSTTVSGWMDFREPQAAMELTFVFADCAVGPFLAEEWRKNFSATFDSTTHIGMEPKENAPVTAQGNIEFSGARIHGLSALEAAAEATETPDLRELDGGKGQAKFHWDGARLEVKDFWAAADNLIRVEGAFTLQDEQIDGSFRLGVRPHVLEAIPGARKYVFDEERDGYVWAPLQLTGPLSSPHQDLKERLVDAARREILGDLVSPITEPVKQAIDLLKRIFGG